MTDLAAKLAEVRALAQSELDALDDQGAAFGMRVQKLPQHRLARAVIAMTEVVAALDDYVEHSPPAPENPLHVRMLEALDAFENDLSPNPPNDRR